MNGDGETQSGTTETPADRRKTRVLSQVYYISQRRSFIATGQRSHSFPRSAASSGMCGCVRDRSSAISPARPSSTLSPAPPVNLCWGSAWSCCALESLQAFHLLRCALISNTDSFKLRKRVGGNGEVDGVCVCHLIERGPCLSVNTGVWVTLDIHAYRRALSY